MYEKIPAEMKADNAWVSVDRWSKVPFQSNINKAASSSDPETWSPFNDAVNDVERGYRSGIGYVFHDTGLIGIDIDAGYDDVFLSDLSIDIMSHCQSYTEKSRSGRGVHIILKGDLPFNGKNNRAGVEIYKTGRYFICTGQELVYPEIIENQEAVDYVVETYFSEKGSTKECDLNIYGSRIYNPVYQKPHDNKVCIYPEYPEILPGGRNICLTSLAGKMHTTGYSKKVIYRELLKCNSIACKPPLPLYEVESIVESVCRYQR